MKQKKILYLILSIICSLISLAFIIIFVDNIINSSKYQNVISNIIKCLIFGGISLFGLFKFHRKYIKLSTELKKIKKEVNIKKKETPKIEQEKNIEIVDNKSNKKEIKYFDCKLDDVDKYECHKLIGTLLHFDRLDKEDTYDGYTNNELKEYGMKVYECNNYDLPFEIDYDNDLKRFIARFTDYSNNYIFGKIPIKYNEIINEIINNKEIRYGGMSFKGGYYKEYDIENDKFNNGYDNYEVTIKISYYE